MLWCEAASVTWSVISDWSTRDCRVYRTRRRVQTGRTTPDVRTNLHLPDIAFPRGWRHAWPTGQSVSVATRAVRPARAPRHTSSMTTMDSDPIPTEPTTDPEPPVTTPVVPGPSLVSESPAAGRGRGSKLRRAAIGLALVLTFSVGIGVGRLELPALGGTGSTTPAPGSSAPTDFGLIREAWDTLHTKYVGADTLNDRDLIYGAINGMTEAVGDTGHTSFMTPEQRAERSSDLSGKYVGIGVRIDTADGRPAARRRRVQGQPGRGRRRQGTATRSSPSTARQTAGHTIDEIVDWVRGEAGSTVKVTVKPGADRQADARSRWSAPTSRSCPVSWAIVPGTKTALVRLDQFSSGAADALKAALTDIKAAGADRHRPRPARQPGRLRQRGRRGRQPVPQERRRLHRARRRRPRDLSTRSPAGGLATDLPLVVLVDGGTASSSEIVSGAIQDAGRAQIVGVKTYGTGTVLGEFPLSDGSALRVGTVEWLTPEGRQIWHEGITPDVVVERASDIAPLDPDQVGKMTAGPDRGADRSAAGPGADARHRGHHDRRLTGSAGLSRRSDRQRQVISAIERATRQHDRRVRVDRVRWRRLRLHADGVLGRRCRSTQAGQSDSTVSSRKPGQRTTGGRRRSMKQSSHGPGPRHDPSRPWRSRRRRGRTSRRRRRLELQLAVDAVEPPEEVRVPADRGGHRLVGVELEPACQVVRSELEPLDGAAARTASPARDRSRSSPRRRDRHRRSRTVPWIACGGRLGGSAYVAPVEGERWHRGPGRRTAPSGTIPT